MARIVQQLFDLQGKTALVTGAASGLGLQLAYALGGAGARLMLTSGNAEELERAVADLQSAGIDTRWVAADMTQAPGVDHLVTETLHRMGDVDIVVNHAPQHWDQATSLYLGSYLMLSQRVAQQSMMARRQGCIINIAPAANSGSSPELLDRLMREAAQGAVVNLTRALAAEWGLNNIRVNAICPSGVTHPPTSPAVEHALTAPGPASGLGGDSLKGACLLFASEAGQHITGQCLTVDTGTPAA